VSASKGYSRSLLGGCLLAFLGLLLAGALIRLLLVLRTQVLLERAIAAAVVQRQIQEQLHPVYRDLVALDRMADRDALALPPRLPLRQDDVINVSAELGRIASEYEFVPGEIQIQVAGEGPSRYLKVELPAEGSYRRLGSLLADLIRLPSIEALQRVSVRRDGETDHVKIDLRLAIE